MKFIIEYTGASGNTIKTDELSFFDTLKSYRGIKKVELFGSPKIKRVKQ